MASQAVVPVLIVPGWTNSGPHHWQSWLQTRHPEFLRVEQDDWDRPRREHWVERLQEYIAGSHVPPLLVAHSLGCHAVVHWATRHDHPIHAALLVAPPDLDAPTAPPATHDFRPAATAKLKCRTIVVASRNDPWCEFDAARKMAGWWGSDLLDAGEVGHLNTAAGFGPWPLGEQLVLQLTGRS